MSVKEEARTAGVTLAKIKSVGLHKYICDLWDIKKDEGNRLVVRFTVFSATGKKGFSSVAQFSERGMDLAVRKLEESVEAERCEVSITYLVVTHRPQRPLNTKYELVIVK